MRNLKINENDGSAEIDLSPNFYHINSVQKTTDDFKKVCKINVSEKDDRIIVKFKANGEGISEITHEFLNHLVANMKHNKLV